MAVPPTSAFAHTHAYVCKSCQTTFARTRNARFALGRTFTIASSPKTRHARKQTQQLLQPAIWWPKPDPTKRTIFTPSRISRLYSTGHDAPRPIDSGIAPLPQRRLISVSGPDTVKFLQGLVTNNVHVDQDQSFFAAFLDSRGRVLWDVFVWVYPALLAERGAWSCYIEVDATEVDALRKHLKRHKLRSKLAIELVPEEELGVWAAWGQAHQSINPHAVVAELLDPRSGQSTLWRILAIPESGLVGDGEEIQDTQQYHLQRYKQGIAEGPQEIARESALPMEVNIDLAQGIDFKKGCYVGQELTIRTKHTGVVRKRMLPVRLEFSNSLPEVSLEPGTDIKQLDEAGTIKKGRAVGKVVAHIGDIGLALCRLEMMTSMRVSAEGGSYKEGMEFGVAVGEDGQIVKVKAVLHDWFAERERSLWAKSKPKTEVRTEVN